MKRRKHTKSRGGCRDCKQRHIRCDERRPSCANCAVSRRICSFLLLSVSRPKPLAEQSSRGSHKPDSSASSSADSGPATTTTPVASQVSLPRLVPGCDADELYALSHIELVHHFEHVFAPAASMGSRFGANFFKIALKQAFRASYLMDQIIALSAAHKSTTAATQQERERYRSEAVRLQTRALADYRDTHSRIQVSNCLPVFFFSSMLAQQAIFEALAYRGDLSTMLDLFVQCFSLYSGIRAIAEHAWPLIQAQFEAEAGEPYPMPSQRQPPSSPSVPLQPHGGLSTEFQALAEQATTTLDAPASAACLAALTSLQQRYEEQLDCPADLFRRAQAVHEWAVHVPLDYIDMLRQRRPEAIVILAAYGVLLHNAREYWSFGDAGRYLVQAIISYLGEYWIGHLDWPNQMVHTLPA